MDFDLYRYREQRKEYRKKKRYKKIIRGIVRQEEMISCVKWIRDENKEVVIFGAGTYGHQIYDILKYQGIETFLFCDNKKCGCIDEKTGVRIVDVDALKREGGEYLILLCIVDQNAYTAIEKQLKAAGFAPEYLRGMREYIDSLTIENLEIPVYDFGLIFLTISFIAVSAAIAASLYWQNIILLLTEFFCVLLLGNSADWVTKVFGKIEVRTIIYQLRSPLKGTGREIVKKYCVCVSRTIVELFAICMLYCLFGGGRAISDIASMFVMTVLLIVEIGFLYKKLHRIGVPQYIRQMSGCSKLYEKEYVVPASVRITFPEDKKNLIYIYLESMEMTNAFMDIETIGESKDNLIPNLTRMALENISFSNTEGYGGAQKVPGTGWTMAGILASTSGISYILPAAGNDSGRYGNFLPKLESLGDILAQNGYKNYFMCGSDAGFAGRDLFFKTHGDYSIFDFLRAKEEGVIPEKYNNGFWGMEDSKLYEYAKDKLIEISQSPQPFNFTLLTVDTHHMDGYICEKCPHIYSQKYANVISCADNQIYDFLNWIKEQNWYKDTVVVITGDHLSMVDDFYLKYSGIRTIYNCFINTQFDKANVKEKSRDFWMADLFPSTLGALGAEIEGNQLGLGVNLFSNNNTLAEKLGIEKLSMELSKYSRFYKEFM